MKHICPIGIRTHKDETPPPLDIGSIWSQFIQRLKYCDTIV